MRILHLLSQLELTGAEAYAVWLADWQIKRGHEVFVVSDRLHLPTQARYTSQPIAKRSYFQRIRNIIFLRRFLKENRIEMIHCHSRAASWVAYATTSLFLKCPIVSTVHGRQHQHKTPRKRDVYGDRVIAVCEHVATHLQMEMGVPVAKIAVIRNGLNFQEIDQIKSSSSTKSFSVALLGRSSGPKGERHAQVIEKVFPKLLAEFPELKIRIAGGQLKNLPSRTLENIQNLNRVYNASVQLEGQLSGASLQQLMLDSSLIIGSGRIAASAIYLQLPTFALGEATAPGMVTKAKLASCLASNFGDISAKDDTQPLDYEKIFCELRDFLRRQDIDTKELSELAANQFDGNKNASAIQAVYESLQAKRAYPHHIPVLMYHKVTNSPLASKHKIFVTRRTFEEHVRTLKSRGYKMITFRDYEAFRSGKVPWKHFPRRPVILSFDDAYLDNFENALPILKRYGVPAVIFALADPDLKTNSWDTDVDPSEPSSPLMNIQQLREFVKVGCEIGAHSLSHRDLTQLSAKDAEGEIVDSKTYLETTLGKEVLTFAYPYGGYNERVKSQVKTAGYKFAVATDTGGLVIEDDPYAIFRVSVFPQDSGKRILRKAASWYRRYYFWKRGQ